MTQSGFIAAIDLGTSKITGVIGRKNENNVISILECVSRLRRTVSVVERFIISTRPVQL